MEKKRAHTDKTDNTDTVLSWFEELRGKSLKAPYSGKAKKVEQYFMGFVMIK